MTGVHGYTLVEVLVSLVLVSIALLGLAGLQLQSQQAELEAYQRAQAMNLVNDMVSRINLNRDARRCYVTTTSTGDAYTLGVGMDAIPPCTGFGNNETRALANQDMAAWDSLLDGAGESVDGADVGGITGARGCITYDATDESITVTVAWQGEAATEAPADNCGANAYGDDALRRTLSQSIVFADLS